MKKRVVYLDYLRLVASFAVIGIHVSGKALYVLENNVHANTPVFIIAAFIDSMLRFAVPIFFMISGALVFLKSEMNLCEFYKKRFKRIVIPLFFWALSYSLVFYKGMPVLEQVKQILLGNGFYHLWFLYASIGLYLVSPVFYYFIKGASKKDIEILLLISGVLNTLLPIIGERYWVDLGNSMNFHYLTGYIFYFLLGYYLVVYDLKWMNKVSRASVGYILSSLLIVWLTITASLRLGAYVTFYINTLWILVILQSISLFVLVKLLYQHFEGKEDKIFNLVNYLGQYFMGIYLIHAFILECYQRIWVIDYYNVDMGTYSIHLLIGMVISYVGAISVTAIFNRIPILKNFV